MSGEIKVRDDSTNPYLLWTRNVKDELKSLSTEAIKDKLQTEAFPFAVMMCQTHSDFNFGTLVRTANNFGAKEVFYYGEQKRWNKSGAQGTYKYTPVQYLKTTEEIRELKKRYTLIGLENNTAGTTLLKDCNWDKDRSYCFVFGEESAGLTPELLALVDHLIELPSFGSVRSLNVGSCGAIVMYDYICKTNR